MRTGAGQHPARRGADDVDDRDHARWGGAPRSGPTHSLNDRSILRRVMLTATATALAHHLTAAHGARVVCLFVSRQCHRPHLRRDRSHVCAATAGLRDGVLRRPAGERAHPAHVWAGLCSRPPEATLQRTHTQARTYTSARAALQRRAPRRVHSAHAIRRTGPIRYSRRADVLQVRYSK